MPDVTASALNDESQTIGTTSVNVLAGNRGRKYLLIQNVDTGTDDIHVRIGETNASAAPTAVADTAGNVRLTPGSSLIFEGGWVPSGPVSIIADAASTPVTIYEGV